MHRIGPLRGITVVSKMDCCRINKTLSPSPGCYRQKCRLLLLLAFMGKIIFAEVITPIHASVELFKGNSTTASLQVPSATFQFANTSFAEISADLFWPPLDDFRGCTLIANRSRDYFELILATLQLSRCNAAELAESCEKAPHCIGVISADDQEPSATQGWFAHGFWMFGFGPSNGGRQFTTIPMEQLLFLADVQDVKALMITSEKAGINVRISVRTGGYNEAADLFASSLLWRLFASASAAHALANLTICTRLLFLYMQSGCKNMPATVPCVLFPEFIANILRFLLALSYGVFHGQLLDWRLYRLAISTPFTLSLISTASISVMLYIVFQSTVSDEDSKTATCRHRFLKGSLYFGALILTADIMHSIWAGFYGDLLPTALLGALYTVFQVPVSMIFIRFGGRVARMMQERADILNVKERAQRARFALRVKMSGWAMGVNIIILVGFVLVAGESRSAAIWLYFFLMGHESVNTVASFQILAVEKPERTLQPNRVKPKNPRHAALANQANTTTKNEIIGIQNASKE